MNSILNLKIPVFKQGYIFLVCLFIIALAQSAYCQTIDKELDIKDSLVKVKGYKLAASYYNKKLLKQPKNHVYLAMLGVIYLNAGEYPKAEKYLNEAVLANNKQYFTYYGLGGLYFQINKYNKATEAINKSKALNPLFIKNYLLLGQIAIEKSEYDSCISIVNNALKIDSTYGKLFLIRGMAYDAKRLSFNARSDFELATKYDSTNSVAWSKRAIHLFNNGQLKEGYKYGLKALQLSDSTYAEYWHFLGLAGQYNNKYEESIECFNRCIALEKNPMYFKLRSNTRYLQEDMDGSCSDLSLAKDMFIAQKIQNQEFNDVMRQLASLCDSTKEAYYYQRGIALYNQKKFQEAINMYKIGLKKFPKGGATYSFLGNAYMAVDSNEKAILNYNLSLAYKDNMLLEYQTNTQYSSRGADTVNLIFKTSIAANYFSIAECYLRINDADEALRYINICIKEMPAGFDINSTFMHYKLRAIIYATRGEYNSANLDFTKAISIDPYDPILFVQRAYMKYCQANKLVGRKMYIGFSHQKIGSVQIPINEAKLTDNTLLYSALKDCNTALENDSDYGWAYYLRGLIGRQLNKLDYCKDFIEAKKLGVELNEMEIRNCIR